MAIKEEFEIRIDKDGNAKIIGKGFSGRECEIPLERLRELLGKDKNLRIEHTQEFYKVEEKQDTKTKKK